MSQRGVMAPRYLVDAMLGNVARKLRMLGYDAEYSADGAELGEAASSGRILVTKNRVLLEAAARRHLGVVGGPTERSIMRHILRGTTPIVSGDRARCTICNGDTLPVPPAVAQGRAPPGVASARFWECASCRHLYWEGTHMERMREAVRAWT